MNRLTKQDAYWMGEEFWTSAEEPDDDEIDKVYMRLKAYEDTGLTPEEVEELHNFEKTNSYRLLKKLNAEERKNRWISVEEQLPETRADCLVTVQYTGFMGMHGKWIKTGHLESDGKWWGDCIGGRVIAWQPLPEPFVLYIDTEEG